MDVRAFLPEGTELATGSDPDPASASGSGGVGAVEAGPAGGSGADGAGASEAGPAVSEAAPAVTEESANEGSPVERAPVDLAVLTRIETDLTAVDSALAALDDGSYGACADCGAEIEPEVMALDPVRLTCAAHPAP